MQIKYDFDNAASVYDYEKATQNLNLIDILDYHLCSDGRYFVIELWSDSNVRASRTEYCPVQQLPTRTIDDELLCGDPNFVQEYPDEDLPF